MFRLAQKHTLPDTPDRLGRVLSGVGCKPKPIKIAGSVVRGMYRANMEAAFERYL